MENNIATIKGFFSDVTTKELRDLSKEERADLAGMIKALSE